VGSGIGLLAEVGNAITICRCQISSRSLLILRHWMSCARRESSR
jgi:hypothetical protein